MTALVDPDCAAGKHWNCDGTSWDNELDQQCDCPCACHARSDAREPVAERAMTVPAEEAEKVWILLLEHGYYIEGEWHHWGAPTTRIENHGWASPLDAVASWKSWSSFTPYLNGRETLSALNGALPDGTRTSIYQRAWFEEGTTP